MRPRTSAVFKMALALNLPSVWVGSIVGTLLFHTESEPALLGFSTFLVPPLWYWIGGWIDLRTGSLPRPAQQRTRLQKVIVQLVKGMSVFLLAASILGLWNYGHNDSETYFLWAVLILWSAPVLVCAIWVTNREAIRPRRTTSIHLSAKVGYPDRWFPELQLSEMPSLSSSWITSG
jgi:hypothetical protein